MQRRSFQLAFITDDSYRAEVVEYLAVGRDWKLFKPADHSNLAEVLAGQAVDLVLIDLELPNALDLFGELSSNLPNVPLLALVTPEHLDALQDARRAGATDFVAFPINHLQFFTTIEHLLQGPTTLEATGKRGRLIVVTGLKGGIGRSTIAVNLAAELAQREVGQVILAEVHHGLSQLSLMLNLRPSRTVAGLAAEASIDLDLIQGYLQPHQSGLRLLAAPSDPAQIAELASETWQQALTLLTELAPYVIVDTAAIADDLLLSVLIQADEILVVTGPEIASLYGTRRLLESLRSEKAVHAQPRLLFNQAEISGGLSVAAIEKHLNTTIFSTILSDPPVATYAFNRGIPFVLSHPHTRIARQFQQLADQLLTHTSTQTKPAAQLWSGLFSFLHWRPQPAGR